MEWLNTNSQGLTAFAAIISSFIAGYAVFQGAKVSRQQKIGDLRMEWIRDLRQALSEVFVCFGRVEELKREALLHTQESDLRKIRDEIMEVTYKERKAITLVELLLNNQNTSHKRVEEGVNKLKKLRVGSIPDESETDEQLTQLQSKYHVIRKEILAAAKDAIDLEFDKMKKGTP